jgi:hypothetical protein
MDEMFDQVKALQHLPYDQYLMTMHWQKQRKGALQRAAYRCQVCNAHNVPLEVHHRTYERLGTERPSDLFVLCESCHELFSTNGKLAENQPDEDPFFDDEQEWDETGVVSQEEDETERVSSWQNMKLKAINHPHLTLGGGSLVASFVIDVFVRFDPLCVVLGLGAAIAIGWKGDDLMDGTIKLLVPGSDQEQAQEDADRFADQMLEDYPVYADQSAGAKLRRLFHLEEGTIVDALPPKRESIAKKASNKKGNVVETGGEGLTFERIVTWFDEGRIDDVQFFDLLERLDHPKKAVSGNRNGNRNDDENEAEEALEADVSPSMEPLRPPGWDEEKVFQLIGAFLAINHLDNSLKAIGLSTSQRNRDFARETLRQQGLLKEK